MKVQQLVVDVFLQDEGLSQGFQTTIPFLVSRTLQANKNDAFAGTGGNYDTIFIN